MLLIEDETEYIEPFITEIEKQYVVDVAYNGIEGSYLSSINEYDVIILDTSLPDMDPVVLCSDARACNISSPILLLSDRGTSNSAIKSLEAGADALLYKPVKSHELSAQVSALIRRSNGLPVPQIKIGEFVINIFSKTVFCQGKPIKIRRKEYDILEYLCVNLNETVTKEKLLEHIWGDGIYMQSNTLEVHVRNLRKTLSNFCDKELIKTVRGYGYRIES
ncbi:DNA-binding response regulator [candidate division WWE3 bacterium]|jgi:DNA-binding response OmpR family regulator|uniref:DNA-binding response regulator n=1 Tax=candidate division WWE3 bacterium TaxID=2053526 RepID=A0A3A4ZK50_UNCKA|nr:MAG: DNA-binding response regulator [candidate division WWE3 bacterium]